MNVFAKVMVWIVLSSFVALGAKADWSPRRAKRPLATCSPRGW